MEATWAYIRAAMNGEREAESFLLKPAVTAVNIANFVEWYKGRGGSPEDLELPFPAEELAGTDTQRWLNYLQHLAFQKSLIDHTADFNMETYFAMGYTALKNRMLAPYKTIAALLPRDQLLSLVIRIAKSFQSYVSIGVEESGPRYCRLRYDIDPDINSWALGGAAHNVTGFVSVAFAFKHGVEPRYKVLRNQGLLRNLLLGAFEKYRFDYRDEDGLVLVDGEPVGRRLPAGADGVSEGIEITAPLARDGVAILAPGEIWDAQCCEVELFLDRRTSALKQMRGAAERLRARTKSAEELELRLKTAQRNYLEALEAKVAADRLSAQLDARNRELAELVRTLESRVEERTANLNATLGRLRELDVLKTNLLATISHELRTPLALIATPLARILRGELGRTIRNDDPVLAGMERQIKRLGDTLDGVLDFTMLEFGQDSVRRTTEAIAAIVADTVADYSSGASEKGIRLDFAARGSELAGVDCAPRLIKTAVANLLSNAVKYTGPGGAVSVAVAVREGRVEITVRDTGIGMDETERMRVFERRYRSEAVRSSTEGHGLGLTLVKEIAEIHGGSVACESVPGKGSAFTLTLPLSAGRPEPRPDPASGPAPAFVVRKPETRRGVAHVEARRARLLYVEDNAELARLLRTGLEGRHAVDLAGDGEEALKLLEKTDYDLVISDVMMPGMDGLELLRRVSAAAGFRKPPFLFLTARADDESKMEALEGGALDYIKKPFDELELRRKIDNIIAYRDAVAGLEAGASREELERRAGPRLRGLGLTEREVEVALLLGQGASKKTIADLLCIAPATAKRHAENIYAKLGIDDRFQLFTEFIYGAKD